MLAKVNELNKNVVILLSVLIIAITSIIVTLIATSESGKGSADSLRDFQEYFISEYGVKPSIGISVYDASESQAQTITESLSKKLNLGDAELEDYEGQEWFSTESKDGDISVSAFFD